MNQFRKSIAENPEMVKFEYVWAEVDVNKNEISDETIILRSYFAEIISEMYWGRKTYSMFDKFVPVILLVMKFYLSQILHQVNHSNDITIIYHQEIKNI